MKKTVAVALLVLLSAVTLLAGRGGSMTYFPAPGTYDMGSWQILPTQYQIASDQTNVYLWPFTTKDHFTINGYTVTQQDSAFTLIVPTLPVTVSGSERVEFSPVCTITPTTLPGTYTLTFTILTTSGNLTYTDTCEVHQ